MFNITDNRIKDFSGFVLELYGEEKKIGFVDVGSGGDLKEPWSLLPDGRVKTFDFEPTSHGGGQLPLCVSNQSGKALFYVANDERASSFHKPLTEFVDRYGFDGMRTSKNIEVERTTLDQYFFGRYECIDAIDINVEGHDFQVLQGASQLLDVGAIKLIKVEFELIPVYEDQGFFADIDTLLRDKYFRLAGIQIDYARPLKIKKVFFRGEPLWGKALYVPTIAHSISRLESFYRAGSIDMARNEMALIIALYASAKLPGMIFDIIAISENIRLVSSSEADQLKSRLVSVFKWAKTEEALRRFLLLWISFFNTFK